MPGSTPATSQLDWLSSTTAMIVLSWSKATRDLLKSFSWGIGALRQLFAGDDGAISFAACPIPSLRWRKTDSGGLPAPTRSSNEAACLIGIVTALDVGPEGALAQRPPDKIRASHLSHGLALRKSDWQQIPMRKARRAVWELAGREVVITTPDKPFFPQAGHTKIHLVRY